MAAPNPEDFGFLDAEEASAVEAIIARRPRGVIAVGLALAAAFMVYRWVMQRRMEKLNATTPELMEQAVQAGLQSSWLAFRSTWVKMTSPLMYAGYLVGVQESGVRLPQDVLLQMSTGYSESLGNYIHSVSSDAMLSGFRALVNRKVDHRRALKQTSGAFGVGPRTMNTLVNVWTAEEQKAYTNVRQISSVKEKRAAQIIAKGIKDRAKALGEHEVWNAKEQAKEASWLWAMDKGIITGAATKMWITADDERVCPSCGPLDKTKIKVTEKFETNKGHTLTPPLHVGCRCEVKLQASMRRILLGQLRKPVRKAYEGHPWARHQKRDEEGQWVKGPSSAHGQPQSALAPQPIDDPEPPEQPPPPPPPSPPPGRLDFTQPAERLSFPPAGPVERLSFAPPEQQVAAPPPVERLSFTPRPQVEPLVFEPPPVERLAFPPQTTPFSHATYTPSQATPQPVAPRPQERVQGQEEQRAAKPSMVTFDRGHELYGVMPENMEENAAEVDIEDLDMVHSLNDLRTMVEDVVADRYVERVEEEFENLQGEFTAKPTKLVRSEGGREYYADQEAILELVQWTRSRQLALEHDEDLEDWTSKDFTITTQTNYDSKEHQLAAETLYRTVEVDDLPIEDLLDELVPTVVVASRVDSELSSPDMSRSDPEQETGWKVRGPHRNFGRTRGVYDPDTGAPIGADTIHIDPLD
jgi:hypothetical protein